LDRYLRLSSIVSRNSGLDWIASAEAFVYVTITVYFIDAFYAQLPADFRKD